MERSKTEPFPLWVRSRTSPSLRSGQSRVRVPAPVLETLQGSRLTLSRGLKSGDGPARASPNSGGAVAFPTNPR